MKKIMTAVIALLFATTASAQHDKKVMLQQILKLQQQTGFVKQGYKIAKEGLNTISDWKNGEFNLHKDHFKSLKTVNPNIKNMDKVGAARELYKEIVNGCTEALNQAQSSGMFVPQEIQYFRGVYDKLIKDCLETLDNLKLITSDGKVEMTDDQRMARINEYHERMQENYAFAVAFCTDMKALEHSRRQYKRETEQLRTLFGLD